MRVDFVLLSFVLLTSFPLANACDGMGENPETWSDENLVANGHEIYLVHTQSKAKEGLTYKYHFQVDETIRGDPNKKTVQLGYIHSPSQKQSTVKITRDCEIEGEFKIGAKYLLIYGAPHGWNLLNKNAYRSVSGPSDSWVTKVKELAKKPQASEFPPKHQ